MHIYIQLYNNVYYLLLLFFRVHKPPRKNIKKNTKNRRSLSATSGWTEAINSTKNASHLWVVSRLREVPAIRSEG